MAFSGALTLTDLNDFITPSQACIKPVEQANSQEQPGEASTEIRIDSTGYYEVGQDGQKNQGKKLEQAQISLNDCLACSGCITSAESVLITLQSHVEVFNFLETNNKLPVTEQKVAVISIAPQTLASFAATLKSSQAAPITPRQIFRRIKAFCTSVLGFDHVFDTTLARHLALQQHVSEFLERTAKSEQGKTASSEINQPQLLPMLASACPGWICYAEKAHPEMLPFIAATKSPQQVMGTLVKDWLGTKWAKLPSDIYHVSVMPCYDKKLEASRSDFYNELYATRDIDCVITTGELDMMMHEKGWNVSKPVVGEDSAPALDHDFPELVTCPGSSSGSYLQAILDRMLSSMTCPHLSVKQIRNSDYEEFVLKEGGDNGKVVFKAAKCYGFRNLQNIVRKVGKDSGVRVGLGAAGRLPGGGAGTRRAKKTIGTGPEVRGYDYVEVMACPGGCVNGGGQLKPPRTTGATGPADAEGFIRDWEESGVKLEEGTDTSNGRWGSKEWTKKVEEMYWQDWQGARTHDTLLDRANQVTQDILRDLCGREDRSRTGPFRTEYRAVESEVVGLAVKW